MIIKIEAVKGYEPTVIDAGPYGVELVDVFCGVQIRTDAGVFGIAQRDSAIEIMLDGRSCQLILPDDRSDRT